MMYRKTVRDLLTEIAVDRRLRLYGFDWDDNILQMPTKIYLKTKTGKVVGMSTEDFAEYRSKIGKEDFKYKGNVIVNFDNNAFRDFRKPETFLRDTKIAIQKNRQSPSFKKFKENLIYANPFSIITARGHNPEIIKKGVKLFIDLVLENQDKKKMIENIKAVLKHEKVFSRDFLDKLDRLSDEQVIDFYLDEKGDYYPVSSEEFGEKFGLDVDGGAANPEHAKKIALLDFISKYDDLIKSGKYVSASLGFSDDDPKNVKAMIEFVKDELSKMYPEVKFLIYDTSEGGFTKINIKTEKEKEDINDNFMLESIIKRILFEIK